MFFNGTNLFFKYQLELNFQIKILTHTAAFFSTILYLKIISFISSTR